MSVSSNSGVSFTGLASGIDSASIISKLMQLENIPVQRVQLRQAEAKQKLSVFGQFRNQLRALSQSAGSIASAFSFVQGSASVTDADMAKVEASANAPTGTFSLKINKLAQAQKITSEAKKTGEALGYSGTFKVNNKSISVSTSDTLADIAKKIQSANAGVSASVVNNGSGSSYLSLTATQTGIDHAVRFEDSSADILVKLGIMEKVGGHDVTERLTTGTTLSLPDKSASLAKVFGIPSGGDPAAKALLRQNLTNAGLDPDKFLAGVDQGTKFELKVGDKTMSYSYRMSLEEIASRAESELGIKPSITRDGNGNYSLDLPGVQPGSVSDSGHLFKTNVVTSTIGETKQVKAGTVLVAAQDAEALVDGILVKSATNRLENAVNGLTITLLKADPTKETSLSVQRSFEQAKGMVQSFVDSYNAATEFMAQASAFNKETFETGPLFGDPVLSEIEGSLSRLLVSSVPGLSSNYRSLTDIGISFDTSGKVALDATKLNAALEADPEAIQRLFQSAGQASGDGFKYVSSTSKTNLSTGNGFDVVITQAAAKASRTKATGTLAAAGSLKFNGGGLSSEISLSYGAGTSAADIVRSINSDSRLSNLFEASVTATGELKVDSKRYGAAGNFTMTATWAGAETSVTGQDVMGTINGEAATGNGQFLTGNTGNAKTEGLQIMVTATTTGRLGSMKFTRGVAALLQSSLDKAMDATNGNVSANEKALQAQIDDFDAQITSLKERATARETLLKFKFDAMERAIAAAQSQGSQLTSMLSSKSS